MDAHQIHPSAMPQIVYNIPDLQSSGHSLDTFNKKSSMAYEAAHLLFDRSNFHTAPLNIEPQSTYLDCL